MTLRNTLTDVQMKAVNLVHRGLLTVSRGRVGSNLVSMPAVQVHTVGRTSGKRRSVMLTAPIHGDGRYVLVASKGGDDRHPDWYLNLSANPEVEISYRGTTTPMTARTASDDEKAEMWPQIVKVYKGYGKYQQKTDRDIPVVICEARDA